MGQNGMRAALQAGADDLGGTLMNESITRAAGAIHGQEMTVDDMRTMADSLGRALVRRSTLYAVADVGRREPGRSSQAPRAPVPMPKPDAQLPFRDRVLSNGG